MSITPIIPPQPDTFLSRPVQDQLFALTDLGKVIERRMQEQDVRVQTNTQFLEGLRSQVQQDLRLALGGGQSTGGTTA